MRTQDEALCTLAFEWADRRDFWASQPEMQRFNEQLLQAHFPQVGQLEGW